MDAKVSDRPVELDLISQLATRDFPSHFDIGLEQEELVAPILNRASQSSPGQLVSWRSVQQQPAVPGLNMNKSIIQRDNPFEQVSNNDDRGLDHDTEEGMIIESPASPQDFQMISHTIDILDNCPHERSKNDMVLSPTGTPYQHNQSEETLKLPSSSKPMHSSGGLFLGDSGKSYSYLDYNHEIRKHSSSLASNKRKKSTSRPHRAAKNSKVSSSSIEHETTPPRPSGQQQLPTANDSPKHCTEQSSMMAWARPTRRSGSTQKTETSLGDAHVSETMSKLSRGVESLESPLSSEYVQSQKALETSYLESPSECESNPVQLIMRPFEYGKMRAAALRFGRGSAKVRSRAFHTACVRLGDLELEKLGLRSEMNELRHVLKRKWIKTNAEDGDKHEEQEKSNKHRLDSIEHATKTSLYFMDLKFWLSLDPEGISESEKLTSMTTIPAHGERLKTVWLALAISFRENMPEVFQVAKCEGNFKINHEFKAFVTDKTLLAGSKIQLFSEIYPEWKAIFSINVKFKIPGTDRRVVEYSEELEKDEDYSEKEHNANICGKSTDNQKKGFLIIGKHHTGLLHNPMKSRNLSLTPSQIVYQKPFTQWHEDPASYMKGKILNNVEVSHKPQQGYEDPSHIPKSFSENNLITEGSNKIAYAVYGQLIENYLSFRKEFLHFDKIITDNQRKMYIVSELGFLGKMMISDLSLQKDEVKFTRTMRLLLRKHYDNKSLGGLQMIKLNEKRLRVVNFATRAVLFFIKIINRLYSPRLFATKKIRNNAQKEGFQLMKNFWQSLYISSNSLSSDKLARLALDDLFKVSEKESSKLTRLAWLSVLYWIREKLPHSFYEEFADKDCLSLKMKQLLGDLTLAEGYRLNFKDTELEACVVRFKRRFILKRPFSSD